MKKIGVFILAALCALLPILGMAAQEETLISTVVPDSHTLTISCQEGGGVLLNGERQTGRFTVAVNRLGTLSLSVDPDDGWELNQVAASPDAGVKISADGSITLENVHEDKELTISFRKLPEPTPTEKPEPTPTATVGTEPTPTATAGTEPTPTATAGTEPTPTATATAGTEPTPTATAGTEPTPTATAETEPTPTATATAGTEPTPTAKPTSNTGTTGGSTGTPGSEDAATPVEPLDNVLYDEYLGTGEGLGQLSIVFDGEYGMEDYELLPIPEDGAQMEEGVLLVCAKPDEEGLTARRSLILSALQIERLHLDHSLEDLIFRNGDMLVTAAMSELCTGRMAKLIQMGLRQSLAEINLESLSWEELPEAELTAAELARARIEVCVSPVTLEDGRKGYGVRVFLRMRDELLDVSALIESLAVNLNVTQLAGEEGPQALAQRVSVVVAAPEETVLESRLRILPEEQPGTSERFDVTIPDDMSGPIVLYSETTALRPYETIVLTAPYAGPGTYMLRENELPPEAEQP